MIIFGIVLIAVAVALVIARHFKRRRSEEIMAAETRTAADIAHIAGEVAKELGPGSFEEKVEVVGRIEAEEVLVSPLGERECVYYKMSVRRRYEEEYEEEDSDGNRVLRTRRGSDTVADNEESCRFLLTDDTGSVLVDPREARFDGLVQTVSSFEPSHETLISFGSFSFSPGPILGGRRTLGYEYKEEILPLDRPLTVLGPVTDKMGDLALRNAGKQKLMVSTRSREELLGSAQKAAKWLLIGGIASALAGAGLTVAGLLGD